MSDAGLVTQIRSGIDKLADPKRAEGVRRAVPGARTNGAPVPRLRELAGRLKRGGDVADFETACRVMDTLAKTGGREELLVGTFLVGAWPREIKAMRWSRIAPWLRRIDNWETCDQLSAAVLATIVNAQPALKSKLMTLARSRNPWQRRLAIATAASLNQRGRSQPAITRAIIAAMKNDPDRKLRLAVGWTERELAKAERRYSK